MNEEVVVLVNERDEAIGTAEKMKAHQQGLLHRAFSVFIFNSRGELLLQQRAMGKYHSAGLWTNTCCSHPLPDEDTQAAAERRLEEELGFRTKVKKVFDFVYRADFPNGLMEHEFDHVFVGEYDGEILFNRREVNDVCYRDMPQVGASLQSHPSKYTEWFRLAFPKIERWWKDNYEKEIQ
ncbi:MAG TPA: isopentenyl-diphosphate Delta-isomerase [Chitinophagaceae bacterium]|nr:isopentenyl-diphosphate Delta-isomerase [Chitinophagaceae bacterium]